VPITGSAYNEKGNRKKERNLNENEREKRRSIFNWKG
jgi:hypothetical protein